jgi:hypothetical protein
MTSKKKLCLFILNTFCSVAVAQTTIPVETKDNAMVLQVGANKSVGMIYLGHKLDNASEYKELSGTRGCSMQPIRHQGLETW